MRSIMRLICKESKLLIKTINRQRVEANNNKPNTRTANDSWIPYVSHSSKAHHDLEESIDEFNHLDRLDDWRY